MRKVKFKKCHRLFHSLLVNIVTDVVQYCCSSPLCLVNGHCCRPLSIVRCRHRTLVCPTSFVTTHQSRVLSLIADHCCSWLSLWILLSPTIVASHWPLLSLATVCGSRQLSIALHLLICCVLRSLKNISLLHKL